MKINQKVSICPRRSRGYTLIELMIVVTMIGIVASIAYSSFTGYTQRADRSQAQADIYEIAQIMERGYTENQDYQQVSFNGSAVGASNDLDFFDDRNPRYNFTVTAVAPAVGTASSYLIQAIPTDESRDNIDMRINQRGTEEFRTHGDSTWSATIGWDNID